MIMIIIISFTNQAIVRSVLVHPDFPHPCKATYPVSPHSAFRLFDLTIKQQTWKLNQPWTLANSWEESNLLLVWVYHNCRSTQAELTGLVNGKMPNPTQNTAESTWYYPKLPLMWPRTCYLIPSSWKHLERREYHAGEKKLVAGNDRGVVSAHFPRNDGSGCIDNKTQNWSGPILISHQPLTLNAHCWKNADMTYQLAQMKFPAIALSFENVRMIGGLRSPRAINFLQAQVNRKNHNNSPQYS